MDNRYRFYGSVAMSILICVIFVYCLFLAFWKNDTAMQQLLIGVTAGAFSSAVGYWIGSSAGSALKDQQPPSQPPRTP